MILVIILFFQVLILPVNIAFFSTTFSVTWLIINGISDTVFLIDVVLNFFTGIPDQEDEHLVSSKLQFSPPLLQRSSGVSHPQIKALSENIQDLLLLSAKFLILCILLLIA